MSDAPAPDLAARGLDAHAVQASLRRMARADEAPWLHREVARRMAERLAIIKLQPALLIDWWSWLGAGSEALAQAYPDAQRVLVEPTPALKQRSEAALARPWWSPKRWRSNAPRVRLDGEPLPQGAQLLWANMMLHAVADPPALFERWQQALAVDGFVMFSCLGPGTLRELRDLYARLGWGEATPNFVDMHDLGDMLVHAGFADPVMDQEILTLQWRDADALLAELRTLGGNASPQRFPGCRTPRWREHLRHALGELASNQGHIALSFEVVYGHAFRAAPRVPASSETSVPLDDIRALIRSRNTKPLR